MLMKKILMVIAQEGFRDEEYLIPRIIFEDEGFDVKVASLKKGEAIGKFGKRVSVDLSLEEVNPQQYQAIIFVGGPGTISLLNNQMAHLIAKRAFELGLLIGAICMAPSILANAGILNNKKATAFISEKENLQEKGAIFTGNDVEIDSNIITANGPLAAEVFAQTIVKKLKND